MLDKIKQLREQTCASMVECKKALEESEGDLCKANDILRSRGAICAAKKAGRATEQGTIESYIHVNGRVGVLVKLSCESDFVARNEMFKELAHNLAMHIAAMNPKYLDISQIPQETIEGEKSIYQEQLRDSGKPQQILDQIIEGKIRKHNQEICLLEQSFVKNQDQSIRELISDYVSRLGENIKIDKFTRFEI